MITTSQRDRIGSMSPEALERLIYVVGSARGGTSLTKDIIGLHDRIVSFDGPTHFLNHPWRHRKRVEDRLWRVIYWLPNSIRRDVVHESLSEERRAAYLKHLNHVLDRKDFRELYQLYPFVRALDPNEQRDPKEALAWLDKGNDFWGVGLLPRYFPQARFVFVVRDPRGSVASLAKRIADARPDTELRIEPRDVIASAIYWRNLVQKQLRFARRYSDRTVFFRYEDLVSRPLEIVPRLFDFLGLPPIPEATLKSKLAEVVYGASLDSKERGSGLSTNPIERWRKGLSTEAVEIIGEICGATARRLGYDVGTQAHHGIRRIAGQMAGLTTQAVVTAKLIYLAMRENQLGETSINFAPLRLLNPT
jgi:hypothetical protein